MAVVLAVVSECCERAGGGHFDESTAKVKQIGVSKGLVFGLWSLVVVVVVVVFVRSVRVWRPRARADARNR